MMLPSAIFEFWILREPMAISTDMYLFSVTTSTNVSDEKSEKQNPAIQQSTS